MSASDNILHPGFSTPNQRYLDAAETGSIFPINKEALLDLWDDLLKTYGGNTEMALAGLYLSGRVADQGQLAGFYFSGEATGEEGDLHQVTWLPHVGPRKPLPDGTFR